MKRHILVGVFVLCMALFACPIRPGYAQATCQPLTGASNVDYGAVPVNTAAVVATSGQTVTGTLLSGCDVGVYVGPGVTGVTVTATITGEHYAGVYVDGGSANIIHSTISQIGDSPLDGMQYGWGALFVQQGWHTASLGSPASGEVIDSHISLYQKAGIVAFGLGTNVLISDNTVIGNGQVTYIAQNGIEVDDGATGKVLNNRVSGNSYIGTAPATQGDTSTVCPQPTNYFADCWSSGGILLVDSGSVTVQGNEASKNDVGIWDYNDTSGPPASSVYVFANNIHDNYGFGLVLDGTDNPTATTSPTSQGNFFTNNPVGLLVTAESHNAAVISLNDQFMGNTVNAEAIQAPVAPNGMQYLANLVVETKPFPFPFPGPHHPPHR
jgi:parallel beta-helix repeat protein